MDNKEQCRKLANRIYELDEKVYKTSGSGLGKTFTGEKARVLDNLTVLIVSNPQGHLLRSELALIGNMARSIRDKDARHDLLIEYNDILEEIANLPMSFGSVDIVDKDLADMNSSILNKNFSEKDHLVICISRSHGSAGTDIGFALAEALHINYYDESVLNQILDRGMRRNLDQMQRKSAILNVITVCQRKMRHFFRQSALIYELAKEEDMIIMGRAADVVLTGQHIPHISIYITAPFAILCAPYDGTEESGSEAGNQSGAQDGSQASGLLSFFYGENAGEMRSITICVSTVHAMELMSL